MSATLTLSRTPANEGQSDIPSGRSADAPAAATTNDRAAFDNRWHESSARARDEKAVAHRTASGPHPVEQPGRGRRLWRWLVIAVAVAACVGGAAWYFLAQDGEEEAQLVLQGNIDVRQVNLSFKVDGRLETLLVDEGDTVKAGQVIATLDKRYFQDELRVARAARDNLAAALAKLRHGSRPEEIAQAKAQLALQGATLERAGRDYERARRLIGSSALARQDVDQYQATWGVAEANVKYAQETLRLAVIGPRQEDIDAASAQLAQQEASIIQTERRLADSDLVAPSDGIILTRAQERGAILQSGATVFTLTLASPVWVRTYVNEPDLGLIRPGMQAQVTTDTAPDRPNSGHIGFISPTAEFTPKTVETRELRTDLVYRLRVVVDNPDGGLRQGMPVTVNLPLAQPRPKTVWQRVRSALGLEGR
jgi:HlyD family secretion protein